MGEFVGRQASFSWSGTPTLGGGTIAGHIIDADIDTDVHETTRFGDTGKRFQLGIPSGTVQLACFIASSVTAAPALPDGTTGTLTITMYGSETLTIKAVIKSYQWRAQSTQGSPPQSLVYTLLIGGDGSTPVVATT